MKKIIYLSIICVFLLSLINTTIFADEKEALGKVDIYFFWADGCPHCEAEINYFGEIKKVYPNINIRAFEVTNYPENSQLVSLVSKKLNADITSIPFTVVGDQYISGWYNEEITGKEIEQAIKNELENPSSDDIRKFIKSRVSREMPLNSNFTPQKLKMPFVGEIDTKNLSLQVLTIVIAAIDGFNPCAMWVLLFLISLLIGMKNKKKMWILGSVFIISSAVVYFLFMTAWLKLFIFLGFVSWIRIAIGIIALLAGYYNLREYYKNPSGGCTVIGDTKRQGIFEKIKKIIQEKHFLLAILGIIILAFSVNLVELICSAGLPAIYTQILAANNLAPWQHYSYLMLYIFIFMLDDLFVFFAAMITLELTGISTKYVRISRLIGGIIMFIIGILMILRPDILMFG